jgi:signal transduction histidine kinase
MTLFIQSILHLKENLVRVNKILNIFIVYFVLATLANIVVLEMRLFFFAQLLFNLFFILIPIFISITIFSTYYLAYFKKDAIAKIYALVWTVVSLVGLLLPLVYLNVININIPSDYIFQFLILFEVLCFSFILAYKIRLMRKEKKSQENFLVHQNKLASMGEMISTIAHQWRQPLSEINGIVLEIDTDNRKNRLDTQRLSTHLNEIEEVTAYLSKTIYDFMNLFNHDKELNQFYISDVIRSNKRLALMSSGNKISFSCHIDNDIEVFGYQSELVQSLLIVINNAVDACKNIQQDSKIIISVKKIDFNRLLISIEDNGGGISVELLPNIFNPYFTTKHEFQGTGLGLYILKMIIEQSMYGTVEIVNGKNGVLCHIKIPINLKNREELRA